MHSPKAVQFVIDWMNNGGMDATGSEAIAYPKGNLENLDKLRKLVDFLGVEKLVNGDIQDLNTERAAKSDVKKVKQEAKDEIRPKHAETKSDTKHTTTLPKARKVQTCFHCKNPK